MGWQWVGWQKMCAQRKAEIHGNGTGMSWVFEILSRHSIFLSLGKGVGRGSATCFLVSLQKKQNATEIYITIQENSTQKCPWKRL